MTKDHQFRRIKKWKLYRNILEKRLASATDFDNKEVNEQKIWQKDPIKTVGFSLTAPKGTSMKHKPAVSVEQDRLQAEVHNARWN